MDTPVVTIKQRVSAQGHPFSEAFIDYAGKRFYSRNWYVVEDTPHNRTRLAHDFLARLQRFPSIAQQQKPTAATCHDDLVGNRIMSDAELAEYARTGVPPRPSHGGYPETARKRSSVLSLVHR